MFPYPVTSAMALSMADGTIHGSPVYELSVPERRGCRIGGVDAAGVRRPMADTRRVPV
jgi:hypothetical protein